MRLQLILLVILLWGAHATLSLHAQHAKYEWRQVLSPGHGRFPNTWVPGKFPMGMRPCVAFDQKLCMLNETSVWFSEDGIQWFADSKTDWGERHGMSVAFYKGQLWAMGGMKSWESFFNDVWSSKDGKEWVRVQSSASWAPRRGAALVAFNEKLWLLGGSLSSGQPNKPPSLSLNDVWSSDDGVVWNRVIENAPWSPREPNVVVFQGAMYVIGGGGNHADVWKTINGKDWIAVNTSCPWEPRQNNGLLVFNEKLWVFGGRGLRDVWTSPDGYAWKKHPQAPWSSRTTECSVVFGNSLWIYSGKTGRADSWAGDLWVCHIVN